MAKTALEIYEGIAKEYGITDAHNVGVAQKLNFAREQAQQMKLITNRLLFDITTSTILQDAAEDRRTKEAYRSKVDGHVNDLLQTKEALEVANELCDELQEQWNAENPDQTTNVG